MGHQQHRKWQKCKWRRRRKHVSLLAARPADDLIKYICLFIFESTLKESQAKKRRQSNMHTSQTSVAEVTVKVDWSSLLRPCFTCQVRWTTVCWPFHREKVKGRIGRKLEKKNTWALETFSFIVEVKVWMFGYRLVYKQVSCHIVFLNVYT